MVGVGVGLRGHHRMRRRLRAGVQASWAPWMYAVGTWGRNFRGARSGGKRAARRARDRKAQVF